eukprot:GHRR01001460.1.p1 GENE.GHRR01001460.1~~GHRR01001460.1.p1  ORF type:complete len:563 (+),score=199.40 GHRR01001460.1:149-1837(+)
MPSVLRQCSSRQQLPTGFVPATQLCNTPRVVSSRKCSSRQAVATLSPVLEPLRAPARETQYAENSIVAFSKPRRWDEQEQPPTVPLYVSLCDEVCAACQRQPEAVRAGLKALHCLGVWGIVVPVWWGQVEAEPGRYDWQPYESVFQVARELGLRVQVAFCFHGDERHRLPGWVLQAGQQCPDVFFTDRAGHRNKECLSIGVDHVPALAGRSALQAYTDLLEDFCNNFSQLLGSVVTDADIGLGPNGELRYPSTPSDTCWDFPGVGEFQCYDSFMVASLSAAAQQVGQPHWGNSGPHDAGSYRQWPHQTGFFHHQGSWDSEYGRFFLQWYSSMLLQHAEDVLAGAGRVLKPHGVRLHARLPTIHWWYNQAAHAAELAAGLYNTGSRNGYLAFCQVLARHGASLVLTGGEMRDCEQPSYALASPETLLLQLRATAASQHVPVTLCNLSGRFDSDALAELERKGFDSSCYRGIDVGHVNALVFNSMSDAMFEPHNWLGFKDWAGRVRDHNAATAAEQQLRSTRRANSTVPVHSATPIISRPAQEAGNGVVQVQQQQQVERESALV